MIMCGGKNDPRQYGCWVSAGGQLPRSGLLEQWYSPDPKHDAVSGSWPLQIKLQLSSSFQVMAGAGDNYVNYQINYEDETSSIDCY